MCLIFPLRRLLARRAGQRRCRAPGAARWQPFHVLTTTIPASARQVAFPSKTRYLPGAKRSDPDAWGRRLICPVSESELGPAPGFAPCRPAATSASCPAGHLGDVALSVGLRTGVRPELRQSPPRAGPSCARFVPRQGPRTPRQGPHRPAPRRCVCVRTPPESPDACTRRADSGASRVLAGRLAACCYTDARKNRPHRGTRRRGT